MNTRPVPKRNHPEESASEAPEIESVHAAFQQPLLRYAWRLLRNVESAQDVVQEVFLKYHTSPPRGEEQRGLSSWLYRVAHNLCIDQIRKEQRMRAQAEVVEMPSGSLLPGEAAEPPEALRNLAAEDARRQLNRMLDGLTENQRVVLVLKVQEEKSYREISEITGLSVSNVGFLIHQAMKKLTELARQREAV